jgi:GTP-binding protein
VIIEAVSQKETLLRFHFNQHFRAENGRPGQGKCKTGADGQDVRLEVPPGTMIIEVESGEKLGDLTEAGTSMVVAMGGRGGQGNARFVSSTNRSPRFAQPGEGGAELTLRLELNLLADAGLVGYPNVGKSTLISRLSAARPKIANYPFTTLVPNLGVVSAGEDHSFVIADLPGLIDGASTGVGLGHRFLKHLSRCRVLVHLLDPTRMDLKDPAADFEAIKKELKAYDPALTKKSRLVAIGKMDLPEGPPALDAFRKAKPRLPVLSFSSLTSQGLDELRWAIWKVVASFGSDRM